MVIHKHQPNVRAMSKVTKAKFKNYLRALKAGWIKDQTEPLIAIHQQCFLSPSSHPNSYVCYMTYGESNGYLTRSEVKDKYIFFYFTEKGLEFAKELAMTTCAFTGRKIR